MGKKGPPVKWTEEKAGKEIKMMIDWLYNFDELNQIHFGKFCRERYYPLSLMRSWTKKWPATCGPLYEEAKVAQEAKLATLGLTKKYEAKTVYFALKNCSGWRDSKDISIDTKDGKAIGVVILPQRKIDKKRNNGIENKTPLVTNSKAK